MKKRVRELTSAPPRGVWACIVVALSSIMGTQAMAQDARTHEIKSPNGETVVTVSDKDNVLVYTLNYANEQVIANARLGLVSDVWNFCNHMTIDSVVGNRTENIKYDLDKIKQSHVDLSATRTTIWASGPEHMPLGIEFVVEDNAVALRYLIPHPKGAQGERGSLRILSEATEFRFPSQTTTYLCPQSEAMIGWKRTKPSYEEEYLLNKPMETPSKFGQGYTFPCLFKVASKAEAQTAAKKQKKADTQTNAAIWALVSETGVNSLYCASHLSDYQDGAYRIAYPMPQENNGNGNAEPAVALPAATPWRTISLGTTAGEAALSTITWDVVEPQWQSAHEYSYGKGTWSWILWQDGSINEKDQRTFIDMAQSLGYQYVLVDNWWDTNIGREGMERLSAYAQSKGVNLVVWYSSSGWWNDIVQGPTNLMCRASVRKAEMRWLKSIGAKGIKVDFFGGDKQETMRLYEDILSDADDAGLTVVFHGATLPRGWERMYPNYVGSEAVLASENLIFDQHFCDTEALCATLHPFIRNAVGCMEFGGSFMNRHMHRDNKRGNVRKTTDAFSIATAVLFQNPVQFFALAPNNLTDAPEVCMNFLRSVPTTWDETQILAGTPGEYVVMARRHADTWYVAAVNATDQEIKLESIQLPFAQGESLTLITDGQPDAERIRQTEQKSLSMNKKTTKQLSILPNGGFVIMNK